MPQKKRLCYKSEDKIYYYRNDFLDEINNNPNITRTELSNILRHKYSYLLHNDSDWFNENVPEKIDRNLEDRSLNWEERDEYLLELLKKKYTEIIESGIHTKVTIKLLDREIKELPINKYILKRCLKSKCYINEIIDTPESYRMKCYKKYIDDCYKNKKYINVNNVISKYERLDKNDIIAIQELEEYIEMKKLCEE